MQEATGLSKPAIIRAIDGLKDKNMIEEFEDRLKVRGGKKRKERFIGIIGDPYLWNLRIEYKDTVHQIFNQYFKKLGLLNKDGDLDENGNLDEVLEMVENL
jgi:hypothetical protein